MKVIFATALSMFTLAVLLQFNVSADGEEVIAAADPSSPELWNVWGATEIEGVSVGLEAVECAGDEADRLCVNLSADNPTAEMTTFALEISLMRNDGNPLARMSSPSTQVELQNLVVQVAAESTASYLLSFELPLDLPQSLRLDVGLAEAASAMTLAAFSRPFGVGADG
jgi:hypothetical protein